MSRFIVDTLLLTVPLEFGINRVSWRLVPGKLGAIELCDHSMQFTYYHFHGITKGMFIKDIHGFKWAPDGNVVYIIRLAPDLPVQCLKLERDLLWDQWTQGVEVAYDTWITCPEPLPFDKKHIMDKSGVLEGRPMILSEMKVTFILFRLLNDLDAFQFWMSTAQAICCSGPYLVENHDFVDEFVTYMQSVLEEIPAELFLDIRHDNHINIMQRWLAMLVSDVPIASVANFRKWVRRHLGWSLDEEALLPQDEQPVVVPEE